jgi:hypothetical protein
MSSAYGCGLRYMDRMAAGDLDNGRAPAGVPGKPCAAPAGPYLTIERESERGIEVERCALVPGFLPRLLAGQADNHQARRCAITHAGV